MSFVPDYDYLSFISGMNAPDEGLESFSALDLKVSEKEAITRFFDADNNKFRFAKKYVELMSEGNRIPDWINEIREVITRG